MKVNATTIQNTILLNDRNAKTVSAFRITIIDSY